MSNAPHGWEKSTAPLHGSPPSAFTRHPAAAHAPKASGPDGSTGEIVVQHTTLVALPLPNLAASDTKVLAAIQEQQKRLGFQLNAIGCEKVRREIMAQARVAKDEQVLRAHWDSEANMGFPVSDPVKETHRRLMVLQGSVPTTAHVRAAGMAVPPRQAEAIQNVPHTVRTLAPWELEAQRARPAAALPVASPPPPPGTPPASAQATPQGAPAAGPVELEEPEPVTANAPRRGRQTRRA